MITLVGVLLFFAVAITITDWRRGLFIAVPVALLQDPLRKLTPGQPVVFVALVGVVIGAAVLAATMSGVSLMPSRIRGWRRYLAAPFGLFAGILLFQAANAFARFGSMIMPMIGLLAYLTPFVGLCLVYQTMLRSSGSENFVAKFLQFYVVCILLFLSTVGLQSLGYDWSVFGEVGKGITIYDQGTLMTAYSGLFRASEIAAWHAATAACFLIILTVSRRMTPGKALFVGILVIAIISLGMLTGRRKFLVEIVAFVATYGTLLLYFGRGAARLALVSGAIGLVGTLALVLFMPDEKQRVPSSDLSYELYVKRTKGVFGDVPDRVTELGLGPISWAYNRYGFLGAGLGAGSQGTQYFGAATQGAAEGGLGKIWLELGAPGFVVVAWLGWALTRHVWSILKLVSCLSVPLSRVAFGLASFLVANVSAFTVATQAYGDIFILLLIGTALGALLAMPVLVERARQKPVLSPVPNSRLAPVAQRT
jgi:hypothetical protein